MFRLCLIDPRNLVVRDVAAARGRLAVGAVVGEVAHGGGDVGPADAAGMSDRCRA
ncbi:MAG: hypothetical protein ACLPLP_28580 [Mycobacterium sp.]